MDDDSTRGRKKVGLLKNAKAPASTWAVEAYSGCIEGSRVPLFPFFCVESRKRSGANLHFIISGRVVKRVYQGRVRRGRGGGVAKRLCCLFNLGFKPSPSDPFFCHPVVSTCASSTWVRKWRSKRGLVSRKRRAKRPDTGVICILGCKEAKARSVFPSPLRTLSLPLCLSFSHTFLKWLLSPGIKIRWAYAANKLWPGLIPSHFPLLFIIERRLFYSSYSSPFSSSHIAIEFKHQTFLISLLSILTRV